MRKMGAHKKVSARVLENPDDQSLQRLQAILLADTFATKFQPVTLERPKVLLPLVNVPMIDYTLSWLESAGIQDVFVFCCAHSTQVIDYLKNSHWYSNPNLLVKTIVSHSSTSAGDVLRYIYQQQIETSQILGDFVLVSGDTVSNMPLADLIQQHRDRKKKDEKAIMTIVIKKSRFTRLGTDQLFIGLNPLTKQLLYYEEDNVCLDNTLLMDASNKSVLLCSDMQDCYIDICSPEVLSLFQDNFDYQHLRGDFVKGLLDDDVMGYKIYTHEIDSSYAARIDNFRSYDTVSKDIISFSGSRPLKLGRQADVGSSTVIGYGTTIGSGERILNSVIGNGCCIGSNVVIEGSYIWNGVTVEDGCVIKNAVVCDGVTIRSGAVVQPGAVLSFKVVVGGGVVVPAYSKVSLLEQPTEEDSDEELEYADVLSGVQMESKACELGPDGAGYIWQVCEGGCYDKWLHSVAPIPKDKLDEITEAMDDDADSINTDVNDLDDDYRWFEREVEATFLRAVKEGNSENLVMEITSVWKSHNMDIIECVAALFYSMMKLAVDTPHNSDGELYRNVANIITKWKGLLGEYLVTIDEQIEVILKLEEMCKESATELDPLFSKILHLLYDKDVVPEDAILKWAEERAGQQGQMKMRKFM